MNLDALEQLILAAGGSERQLTEATKAHGLDAIAAVLADEIAFRATTGARSGNAGSVQLEIHHNGAVATFTLHVSSEGTVSSSPGVPEGATMRLEYALHDLVRLIFGPARPRATGTFAASFLPAFDGGTALPSPLQVLGGLQVNGAVLSGLSQHHPDLGELARAYLTDKWGGVHWFADVYEQHLRPYRDLPVRVLEIGIGGYGHPAQGGEGMRVWKRYFHRGLIVGADIYDKSGVDAQRMITVVADQSSPAALAEIDEQYGPFDIIIDDGSHVNAHVRTSFEVLFPRLRSGGLYVVEDLYTSFWPGYGGDPSGGPFTSVGMVNQLVMGLQHQERPGVEAGYSDRHVTGVHAYHNLAFIEKGVNREGGVPSWVPREPLGPDAHW